MCNAMHLYPGSMSSVTHYKMVWKQLKECRLLNWSWLIRWCVS